MTPRYTVEKFVEKIKIYYKNENNKDDNYIIRSSDRIPMAAVQYFLGVDDREMYILLNTFVEKLRIRTNLEEEASIHRYCLSNGLYRMGDEDRMMPFYREAIEGLDYQIYEDWCVAQGESETTYDAYKKENEQVFIRCISNLSVRYDEIGRFVNANPEIFLHQALDFDFEQINPIHKIASKENEYAEGYNITGKPFIDLVTKLIKEKESDKEIALELKRHGFSGALIGAALHPDPERALTEASNKDTVFVNYVKKWFPIIKKSKQNR